MGSPIVGLIQASPGLIDVALKVKEAGPSVRKPHAHMKEKMTKLQTIRVYLEQTSQIFWIPSDKIDRWSVDVEKIERKTEEFDNLEDSTIIVPQPSTINEIIATCTEIDHLIQEGKELEDTLKKTKITRIVTLPTPINIANIKQLSGKLDQLLQFLEDDSVNVIKVHARLAGRGEKVLIQHLNNHPAIAKTFDIVFWVSASGNLSKDYDIVAEIQKVIAKRLGLSITSMEDKIEKAARLKAELGDAKCLLLLEDVKEEKRVALETLGLPTDTKGSKIVYTTNLPINLFGLSESSRIINVEKLEVGDSWKMFENILSKENKAIAKGGIKKTARKIVELCYGHFNLIRIAAENMIPMEDEASWSNALETLRKSAKKTDTYMKALENSLHCSYNGLKEYEKNCFLFSLLYPQEYEIPRDCLFDCWAANNLLADGVIGQNIVTRLSRVALFGECSNKRCVTMDKITRTAAMYFLDDQEKYKCLVAQEAPPNSQNDNWKDLHWISFAGHGSSVNLPTEVHCEELTTLLLQMNSKLEAKSSSFFEHTKKLIVLDLYKTIFDFELRMENLQKLKVLYINGRAMSEKLPLKIEESGDHEYMLEVLDIRSYKIFEIPDDFKLLKHLRRLILSIHVDGNPRDLKISKLESLKELIIDVKSDVVKDGTEDAYMTSCHRVIEDTLMEIDSFKKLVTLKFYFEDFYNNNDIVIVNVIQVTSNSSKFFIPKQCNLQHMFKEINAKSIKGLEVYIGLPMTSIDDVPELFSSYDVMPELCSSYDDFVLSSGTIEINDDAKKVFEKVRNFIMMKNDSPDQHLCDSSSHFNHWFVKKCNGIGSLFGTNSRYSNLKTLGVSDCSRLEALFAADVQEPMNIIRLEIRDCTSIKEINMSSASGRDMLPQLKTLALHNLPMLEKISFKEWSSMETLEIHNCPMLTEVPLDSNNAKKLRRIRVEKTCWTKLQLSEEIKQKYECLCDFS